MHSHRLRFGLLVMLNVVAGVLRGLVLQHVQSAVSMRIGVGLFRHLIRLPYAYFEKRDVGGLVSRLASADTLRNMLAEGMVSALVDGAMAILTMIMMLVYAPMLAGFVVASLMIYAVLRIVDHRPCLSGRDGQKRVRYVISEQVDAPRTSGKSLMLLSVFGPNAPS